jgi:LysM repeat protein
MRKIKFNQKLALFFIAIAGTLEADVPATSQSVARAVQNLTYSVNNQDQEIAALKQKIQNQETVVESMHSEVSSLIKATKDAQKKTGDQVDSKLKSMEKNLDKLVADLKQFKKHANDSSSTFADLQKKLKEQEEISTLQAQQIKDLEAALRSLATAMQSKVAPKTSQSGGESGGEYKVKSGDSLDKIAKDQGVSIEAIRKANNLQKDTIYPGQKLVIPNG